MNTSKVAGKPQCYLLYGADYELLVPEEEPAVVQPGDRFDYYGVATFKGPLGYTGSGDATCFDGAGKIPNWVEQTGLDLRRKRQRP